MERETITELFPGAVVIRGVTIAVICGECDAIIDEYDIDVMAGAGPGNVGNHNTCNNVSDWRDLAIDPPAWGCEFTD